MVNGRFRREEFIMKRFVIALKLFCKTLSISIPYSLLLAFINIGLYRLTHAFALAAGDPSQMADAMYYFGDINIFGFGLYLFFIFVGYEYMRKVRESNMEEIFFTYGKSGVEIYGRQYLVLILAVILVSLNVSVYYVWGWKNLSCAEQLAGEVVRLLFVNVFLLSLSAVSIGTVLSRLRNRFAGYAVIVLLLFFILPNTVTYLQMLQTEYHLPVFAVRDLIYLISPDILAVPDALYGFPLESYRIAAMMFWIAGAVVMLVWKMAGRHKTVQKTAMVFLCLLMGFFLYQTESKGSILLMQEHPESATDNIGSYYSGYEGEEREADFSVTKYEMNLEMGKELDAEVWMTLESGSKPEEYFFTLNHVYQVREVKNENGESLPYVRDGDYIMVKNGKKGVSRLCIVYRGHSPVFYANKKACFLPGFFAYYPKAGYRKSYFYRNGFLYTNEQKTLFEVKTDRKGMFCNLSETTSGFEGEAEALTLVDGYYDVSQAGGRQMVSFPLMENEYEWDHVLLQTLPEELEKLKKYLDIEEVSSDFPQKIIMVPGSLAFTSTVRGYYPYEDHAVVSSNATAYDVLKSQIGQTVSAEKRLLCRKFFDEKLDGDFTTDMLYWYNEESDFSGYANEEEELSDVFATKVKELGVQNAARKIVHYLLDNEDGRDSLTFLKEMGE